MWEISDNNDGKRKSVGRFHIEMLLENYCDIFKTASISIIISSEIWKDILIIFVKGFIRELSRAGLFFELVRVHENVFSWANKNITESK